MKPIKGEKRLEKLSELSSGRFGSKKVWAGAERKARVGKTVAPSTVYRALKQHGWRKVVASQNGSRES